MIVLLTKDLADALDMMFLQLRRRHGLPSALLPHVDYVVNLITACGIALRPKGPPARILGGCGICVLCLRIRREEHIFCTPTLPTKSIATLDVLFGAMQNATM